MQALYQTNPPRHRQQNAIKMQSLRMQLVRLPRCMAKVYFIHGSGSQLAVLSGSNHSAYVCVLRGCLRF